MCLPSSTPMYTGRCSSRTDLSAVANGRPDAPAHAQLARHGQEPPGDALGVGAGVPQVVEVGA
jgi:hypothetical protein